LWFAAGIVLAITAGLVAFATMRQATSRAKIMPEPARVQVVVATRNIRSHAVLGAADVALQEVPPEVVPEDWLKDPGQAIGQLTTVDTARGEIIQRQRLIAPDYVGPRAAFVMDPEKVIVAFPTQDLLNSAGIIRPGDRVDIMFTLDFARARPDIAPAMNTLCVLQDLKVAAVLYAPATAQQGVATPPVLDQPQEAAHGPAQAMLLAVDPQDALMIKYFRDAGAAADLALRSPAAETLFDVRPVDNDYLLQRYQIRWRSK